MFKRLVIACCMGLSWGCHSPTAPREVFVKVVNVGSTDINDLVLQFPNGAVNVGNVPGGTESGLVSSSGAVYRFAAFDFVVDGVHVRQPVTDWAGEKPLNSTFVTYSVSAEIGSGGPHIEIRGVREGS